MISHHPMMISHHPIVSAFCHRDEPSCWFVQRAAMLIDLLQYTIRTGGRARKHAKACLPPFSQIKTSQFSKIGRCQGYQTAPDVCRIAAANFGQFKAMSGPKTSSQPRGEHSPFFKMRQRLAMVSVTRSRNHRCRSQNPGGEFSVHSGIRSTKSVQYLSPTLTCDQCPDVRLCTLFCAERHPTPELDILG